MTMPTNPSTYEQTYHLLLEAFSKTEKTEYRLPVGDAKTAERMRLRWYSFMRVMEKDCQNRILSKFNTPEQKDIASQKLKMVDAARRFKATLTDNGDILFVDRDKELSHLADDIFKELITSPPSTTPSIVGAPHTAPTAADDSEDFYTRMLNSTKPTSDQFDTPHSIPRNPMDD
jgi:hypothetical protein